MLNSSEQSDSRQPRAASQPPPLPQQSTSLAEALALAERLEPNDRTRLIASLWQTLPAKNRTAFITFGLENNHAPAEEPAAAPTLTSDDYIVTRPPSPGLWEALFDPAKTSDIYSAPRRFDLATIFVVTAAYSILLGGMTLLDSGPATKVVIGLFVTSVGVFQALYQQKANPRGVSIVAGSISLSVILIVTGILMPRVFAESWFAIVVFGGIIGGAIAGYLAGTLVGGVFLIADVLRKRFTPAAGQSSDVESSTTAAQGPQEDSPWTS